MAGLSVHDLRGIERNLRKSVIACNDRGLYNGAKWAAELLNSLPADSDQDSEDDTDVENDAPQVETSSIDTFATDAYEAKLQRRERSKFLLAKSCFECKEYDRCAVTLVPELLPQQPLKRDVPVPTTPGKGKGKANMSPRHVPAWKPSLPEISQRSLFLALYARYIAGEKRKEEESEMILGPSDGPVTANKELASICGMLDDLFKQHESLQKRRTSDGFLEYLYGVVLAKSRNEELAKAFLLRSVTINEWNWSAWVELSAMISTVEELSQLSQHIQPSIPSFLFQVHCSQELYQSSAALHARLDQLSDIFPTSPFLLTQRALLFYHAKDFDSASAIFSSLLQSHPYRLDAMDTYSNILYVLPTSRSRLSHLATLCSATDRFRPETCIAIGNHYSRSSEHEKAIIYFRRALTLDRAFLSAWTLMGHEYIELKNTQAAIESYRRAVDANRKDYRAWHGLGLGYELLDMHSYALYYYQRAAALQPWDPKMWAAVGASFERCGRPERAIRALKRALGAGSAEKGPTTTTTTTTTTATPATSFGSTAAAEGVDPLREAVGGRLDVELLVQIASLYEGLGEGEEARAYMELCLLQEEGAAAAAAGLGGEEGDGGGGVGGGVGAGGGIGVTVTTSRARLWLARWAFGKGEWDRCVELANELCQDGFEVEEAKALIKDVRARRGEHLPS